MGKHGKRKLIDDLFEDCASANECTGLFQKVPLDKDEVAKFHRQYIGEEDMDK